MKRLVVSVFSILVVVAMYGFASDYTFYIGSDNVKTDYSKFAVLANNFIGDIRGYAREDFSNLSLYLVGDNYELIAVKSDDGRMIGHEVDKYTSNVLKKLIADGKGDSAYHIVKSNIGDRVIYPLRFITFDEIESRQYFIVLPIPQVRDISSSMPMTASFTDNKFELSQITYRRYIEIKK